MALTKVTGQVIKNTTDVTVGVLTVTNTLAVGGTVSIGGTLTYEDVTNVDAVGLITARNGIVVGSGITLSKDGDIFATGITTVSGNVKVGTGITLSPDGDIFATGVTTATTFVGNLTGDPTGSGANLTNLPAANLTGTLPAISGANLTNLDASDLASGTVPTARLGSGTASSSTFLRGDSTFAAVTSTTINSNTNNYLITGTGTADTLQGESGLTYDGDTLTSDAAMRNIQAGANYVLIGSSNAGGVTLGLDGDSNGDGAGTDYAFIEHDTSGDLNIVADNPADASNIKFFTNSSTERMRITSAGDILIGNTNGGAEAINMVGGGGGILISRNESSSPSDGQTLGDIGLNSYSSSQTCSSADVLIRGQADGAHSGSSAGSALLLFTKPASTGPGSAPTERLRINKSGAIGIAGANYGSAGQVLTSNGSGSAVAWAAASGGKVLQVVSSVKRDTASNATSAGSTWEYDDSSLRVQITAANASNTFLILASVTTASGASVHTGLRDSSSNTVLMATGASSRRAASSGHDQADTHSASTVPIIGTITAGDTNQHSFYFQFSHTSGSALDIYLNRSTNDGDAYDRGRYVSSIVVMEIEA